MSDDRTTIELSESIRDRLREFKDNRGQTYDSALDDMLSAFGYVGASSISSGYRFTDPEYVFRCKAGPVPDPICVYAPPYRAREAYLYKTARSTTFTDFLDEFEPIMRYFGLFHDKRRHAGSFVINQNGYNWFGYGFDNFLETCSNQEERYAEIDDLNPHHSEMAVYIYDGGKVKLMIHGQPSALPDSDHIQHGGLNLLTHGCPTRRDFINLLEQAPVEMSNGLNWNPLILDWWNGRTGYGPRGAPPSLAELDPRSGASIMDESDDTIGYLCENPYYERPELLLEELNIDGNTTSNSGSHSDTTPEQIVTPFTNTEQTLLRTMPHKPTDETGYEYERLTIGELPSMDGIGRGTTVNIKTKPIGEYV